MKKGMKRSTPPEAGGDQKTLLVFGTIAAATKIGRPRDLMQFRGDAYSLHPPNHVRGASDLELLSLLAAFDRGRLIGSYLRWFDDAEDVLTAYGIDASGGPGRHALRRRVKNRLMAAGEDELDGVAAQVAADLGLAPSPDATPTRMQEASAAVAFEVREILVPTIRAVRDPLAFFNHDVFDIDSRFATAVGLPTVPSLVKDRAAVWGPRVLLCADLRARLTDENFAMALVEGFRSHLTVQSGRPGRPRREGAEAETFLAAYREELDRQRTMRPRGAVLRTRMALQARFNLTPEGMKSRLRTAKRSSS